MNKDKDELMKDIGTLSHDVTMIRYELKGLSVLLNNLTQEVENGNRHLSMQEANEEMLDSLTFASSSLMSFYKRLGDATSAVGY